MTVHGHVVVTEACSLREVSCLVLYVLWTWRAPTSIGSGRVFSLKSSVFRLFPLTPPPNPGNHWLILCLHSVAFFGMYTCNHTVCSLFRWISFTWSYAFNVHPRRDGASLVAHNLLSMWETWVWSLGLEDSTGGGNGSPFQYSYLEIPWTEEPGGLQSMGSERVWHDWATNTSNTLRHWE